MKFVHGQVQQRTVEPIVDVPVPQMLREIVEEMLAQCSLNQNLCVDVPVPEI